MTDSGAKQTENWVSGQRERERERTTYSTKEIAT